MLNTALPAEASIYGVSRVQGSPGLPSLVAAIADGLPLSGVAAASWSGATSKGRHPSSRSVKASSRRRSAKLSMPGELHETVNARSTEEQACGLVQGGNGGPGTLASHYPALPGA